MKNNNLHTSFCLYHINILIRKVSSCSYKIRFSFFRADQSLLVQKAESRSNKSYSFTDDANENDSIMEPYYVGFIMRHVDMYSESSGKFKIQFVKFIRSIFKNLKRLDRDIHFIILTDYQSSPHVIKLLEKFTKKDVFDKV